MVFEWRQKKAGNPEIINRLQYELQVDSIIANLLAQRGIFDFNSAKNFFNPSQNQLHSPFLMKNMQKAVERIHQAIHKNEKILIIGDYDVDGTTSVALLFLFFSTIINAANQILYYIPNRETEGYGVSFQGIDYAVTHNCSLIISVDCGIRAHEKIHYANKKNIDFIICDHHLPADTLPTAFAILNPKQSDCNFPYKDLSGCAVAFKLIQAYAEKYNIGKPFHYIDLVAVSIASDIVQITGENRILTALGLEKLNKNPLPGLKAILKVAGIENKKIEVDDIVFKISPRLNAAGRLYSGITAVELLTTGDSELTEELSKSINEYNIERRNYDKSITAEALQMIENDPELKNAPATIVCNQSWHKGVVGIVASRLIENYYRPTIVLTQSNGIATGSARSVEGFDLYSAIDACGNLLEKYGGHHHAAGLSLKIENLEKFRQQFNQIVSETISPKLLIPHIEYDMEIPLSSITPKLYRIIQRFKPFGPGNMTPVFCSRNITDNGSARIIGNNEEHLKLSLFSPENQSVNFPAIAFSMAHFYNTIKQKHFFNACYTIEENTFQGRTSLQLNIRDIKFN